MSVNLSDKGKQALDEIRQKVKSRDPKWTNPELDKLDAVYSEITKLATGKDTKPLDRTCINCSSFNRAIGIVYNYITYHEQKPVDRQSPAKVITVKTNNTEHVGTLGIKNWDARKTFLLSCGFVYSKEENVFKLEADTDRMFSGDMIGSLSEADFKAEVSKILEAEKGNDAGPAFDQHNPTPEVVADRIEQLMGLGYTYDSENAQYNAPESKSMVTAAALQTMPTEDFNMLIDAEEGFQHSHALKHTEVIPGNESAPVDDKTAEEDKVQLKYDPATDQVVILEEDGTMTPFTEELDVLLFPVLFDLAKQKGWKGARPPKAKLVEFLTKPTN